MNEIEQMKKDIEDLKTVLKYQSNQIKSATEAEAMIYLQACKNLKI